MLAGLVDNVHMAPRQRLIKENTSWQIKIIPCRLQLLPIDRLNDDKFSIGT